MKHTICPACKSSSLKLQIQCHDYLIGQERFDIDECGSCGLLMTQPIIPQEEIGKYYQSTQYVSHSNTQKGLFFKAYHLARTMMLRQKGKLILKYHPKTGSLLDIGAGTGYFVQYMQSIGWKTLGVEISEDARNFAKQEHGLNLLNPHDFYRDNTASFDAVTLWHVMEHLPDFNALFSYIYSHLNENGTLVIAVPNCNSYDAEHYGAFWAAYDVPRHLWHFKPQVMTQIAQNHKFTLVEKKSMPLDTFYVSMLSEQYQKRPLSLVLGGLKSAWFIFKSLFHKDRSSSLIYVFKKSN